MRYTWIHAINEPRNFSEVKKNSADKWGVFYESVGGTMYFIINEQD
jgi:hypothetical protein